jgi:hypothetical protein
VVCRHLVVLLFSWTWVFPCIRPFLGVFDLFMMGRVHQTRHEMVQKPGEFSLKLSSSTPREIPTPLKEQFFEGRTIRVTRSPLNNSNQTLIYIFIFCHFLMIFMTMSLPSEGLK